MKPIEEIRRDRLAVLVAGEASQASFARKIGKDKNQVNQWLGRAGSRNMSAETAREIERKCAKPPGWMDSESDPETTASLQSHSVSEVREKMNIAAEMVLDQFERWGLRLRPQEDSDLIVGAFDILIRPTDNNVIAVTRWLAEQAEQRGLGHVGQSKDGYTGEDDRRTDTGAKGRKAKTAAGGTR